MTPAVQTPNIAGSGMRAVDPYGSMAWSDRSTRVHRRSARGNRALRPTSSVSRSSSHVKARAASTGLQLNSIPADTWNGCALGGVTRDTYVFQ